MPITRTCNGGQHGENAGGPCYPELCGDLVHWACWFCRGDLTIYALPEDVLEEEEGSEDSSPRKKSRSR